MNGPVPSPTPRPRYSFYDAASRAQHPLLTALLATGAYGTKAPSFLDALQQREERQRMLGQQVGLKAQAMQTQGDLVHAKIADLLSRMEAREQAGSAPPPEGYQRDPATGKLVPGAKPGWKEGDVVGIDQNSGLPVVRGAAPGTFRLGRMEDAAPPAPNPPPQLGPPSSPAPGARAAPGALPPPPTAGSGFRTAPPGRPAARPAGIDLRKPGSAENIRIVKGQGGHQYRVNKAGQVVGELSDEAGNPIFSQEPANLAGMNEQLDNVEMYRKEMSTNYAAGLAAHPSGARRGLGTASASILGMGKGGNLGFSYVPGKYDPYALQHERYRKAAAAALVFPLTGSRRAQQGTQEAILDVIPHYSDPPEVWQNFDRQLEGLIQNARKMPWGNRPGASVAAFRGQFQSVFPTAALGNLPIDPAVAQEWAAGGAAPNAPSAGGPRAQSIRRSQLRGLSPQDAADTEADAKARGVQIIEDQ